MQSWQASDTRTIYRRFQPGESLIADLESFALAEGIREAAITSCIGSLRQLKLRNLCRHDEDGSPEFQRTVIDENLELSERRGLHPAAARRRHTRTHTRRRRAALRRDGRRSLRRRHHLHRRVHVSPRPGRRSRNLTKPMQSPKSQRLSGKVAIVSGAGTYGGSGVGNGAAAAIVFAREGAKVVLVDAVQEWAEATQAIIEEEGGEALTAVADVTSSEDCRSVVDAAVEGFGGLHICTTTSAVAEVQASWTQPKRTGSAAPPST